MRDLLKRVLGEYADARDSQNMDWLRVFQEQGNEEIRRLLPDEYEVFLRFRVTAGQWAVHGKTWAEIPWIGIRDPRFTDGNFMSGVYVVYLFSADGTAAYLCVAQGVKAEGARTKSAIPTLPR
jgi:hypothetical protein